MTNTVHPDRVTHYFYAPAVTKAEAKAFGIVVCVADGKSHYYWDEVQQRVYKEVGWIFVRPSTGRIYVWPYTDVSQDEKERLIGSGENAFRNPPRKAEGWGLSRRKKILEWRTVVSLPVREDGSTVAAAVAANVSWQERQRVAISQQMSEVA